MPEIQIDGKIHEVKGDKNLLEVILSLGYDLPYFCWHPAMGSVGSCRQCAIRKYRNEDDHNGQIVMACMEPVAENLRISISEKEVREFRKNVVEWLMINHPHDCPICDEGGECHLQDMTVMAGHSYRKFRYKKRTYNNQDLGPCINHEMNRCIQCYRCVRFYNDYAGGKDLQVFAAHDHVYFGRHADGTLESEFSGNLVEVCPTGVFTDKTLKKHYTRKWDLTSAASVCHLCSLGCNILAGERYGTLRRIMSRFNEEVNGYFICDRGRFGYDFVNGEQRTQRPMIKTDGEWQYLGSNEAVDHLARILQKGKGMGIGSPRASLESNYVLRILTGEENFYNGISGHESELIDLALGFLQNGPLKTPSLKEIEEYDAVIVIGEDVTNTAPMIDLALKQSVLIQPLKKVKAAGIPLWNDAAAREFIQEEKGPLYILTPQRTKLDEIARQSFHDSPEDLVRLVSAIGHALDPGLQIVGNADPKLMGRAQEIATSLANAERPLVITGTSLGNEAVIKSALNLARALYKQNANTGITFIFPECNSLGMVMMEKKSLNDAITAAIGYDTIIILENDLFRRMSAHDIRGFLDKFNNIIVLDHTKSETVSRATQVFPAGTFAEADGTLVNNEGRAQRFFQVQATEPGIKESWRWIVRIGQKINHSRMIEWTVFDDIFRAIENELSTFKGISKAAPLSDYRIHGQKIARAPQRYSGRTAMFARHAVSEPKPPDDPDSPLSFTMEGFKGERPSSLIPFYWSPGWNSVQSINKFQIEIGGPMHQSDPGVRLIEPSKEKADDYFIDFEDGIEERGKWKVLPLHHIFGSEELSIKSSALFERSPGPSVSINQEEAEGLGIADGEDVVIAAKDFEIFLPARIDMQWPKGYVGLSAAFPGVPFFDANTMVTLKKRMDI